MEHEELVRYPIGLFNRQNTITPQDRMNYITEIRQMVPLLQDTLKNLTVAQLQTPYRSNGWTSRQLVHHMADNDMNAFLRLKRALTEREPQASSYREDLWAELNDYSQTPVSVSIQLLSAIHFRMIKVLEGLRSEDYDKKLRTNVLGSITVDTAIQRFIWHNKHHTAQIQGLIKRMEW